MLEDEDSRNSKLLFEASFPSQGLTIRTSTHNLRKTFPISYYPIIIIFKKCLEETYLVKCSTKLSCKNSQPLQKSDLERKIPTGSHRALGFLKKFFIVYRSFSFLIICSLDISAVHFWFHFKEGICCLVFLLLMLLLLFRIIIIIIASSPSLSLSSSQCHRHYNYQYYHYLYCHYP